MKYPFYCFFSSQVSVFIPFIKPAPNEADWVANGILSRHFNAPFLSNFFSCSPAIDGETILAIGNVFDVFPCPVRSTYHSFRILEFWHDDDDDVKSSLYGSALDYELDSRDV
ncbi:hypothetical protein GCK32_010760 [Trichostrongylus colubriformis]|uniref:Uncharacterized protein n=1 Tax=Trichostrongylus colubriformis TaxID=6319 RepID=A0AAN8F4U6_TRICO